MVIRHGRIKAKDIKRFCNHIRKERGGCWWWTGFRDAQGYGMFNLVAPHRAHRIAYAIWKRTIPSGKIVRHTCDNPACVNPKHLLTGTHQDNFNDAVKRGRSTRKLTAEQVTLIRKDSRPARRVAADYSVTAAVIYDIKDRVSWKWVP